MGLGNIVNTSSAPKRESLGDTNLKQFLTKRTSIHDYEIGQKLGEGAYAIVRQCRHKESNSKIAMKIYDKIKLSDPVKKRSVSREITLL